MFCKCVLQIHINWLTVCDRVHGDGDITQLFHSVISVNLSSVTSICLLNLSHSLLFLSYTKSIVVYSLVVMLHHVLWLCVCSITFCTGDTHRSYNTHIMTTQCGAFRVCSINFCVCNTHIHYQPVWYSLRFTPKLYHSNITFFYKKDRQDLLLLTFSTFSDNSCHPFQLVYLNMAVE